MIQKILLGISSLLVLLSTIGCDSEHTVYDGPDYIMFSDSLYILPIQNNEDFFEIPVSATRKSSKDRVLAVEIIDKNSNAIEGKHYELESNTITIKAGELATSVKVRGEFDNITVSDSLGFALRLITDNSTHWGRYGIDANVVLYKVCPFDIDIFTGYCVVTSTYFQNYMPNVDSRLIKSRRDPDNPNGVILENYFYDGYDVKIEFDTSDPLNPLLITEDQIFAETSEAFGTIYGDGLIHLTQPSIYVSYYSTCEAFVAQYLTLSVPNVGTVGTFLNLVKWISDDEAEVIKNSGY